MGFKLSHPCMQLFKEHDTANAFRVYKLPMYAPNPTSKFQVDVEAWLINNVNEEDYRYIDRHSDDTNAAKVKVSFKDYSAVYTAWLEFKNQSDRDLFRLIFSTFF